MKKILLSMIIVLACSSSALAEGALTIVATPAQIADMSSMLNELATEKVTVKTVNPEDISTVLKDKYIIVVTTPGDPTAATMAEKLSAADQERIAQPGGAKYILLRAPWVAEQEVVVFAAHSEDDAAAVRKKTRSAWWGTVATWYDINTQIVPNY